MPQARSLRSTNCGLTHKPWLYWLALLPTVGGVVMGLAGLLGWHLHPDALSRLLS